MLARWRERLELHALVWEEETKPLMYRSPLPNGESRKRPPMKTPAVPVCCSLSEATLAALRYPLTHVRTRRCGLKTLSHLFKRCRINLSTRIALLEDF